MADEMFERANALIEAHAAANPAPEAWARQRAETAEALARFGPVPERVEVTYTPAPPKCRVFWGSHGCMHERGHDPEIPHECSCCECEQHPDPDPDNPNGEPSCVAGPPYYGKITRFYGEDAVALGLPLVKGA